MAMLDHFGSFLNGIMTRSRGAAPWEGTVPLTGQTLIDFFSADSRSTRRVSPEEALSLATVYRCASILSSTVANANVKYTDLDGDLIDPGSYRGEDIVANPNPMLDPFNFWESAVLSVIFHGNFYAIAQRDGGRGPYRTLTPLDSKEVEPKATVRTVRGRREIVDVTYVWTPPGREPVGIPSDEIFHVAGMGFDGLTGMSILQYARRVFSLGLNADDYADRFFGKGFLSSGVLTTDKRLDEDSSKALKQRWRDRIQGIENAFDIVVLDSGASFQSIQVDPADAQFIESRKFGTEEIGRMFGIDRQLLSEGGDSQALDPEHVAILFTKFTGESWTKRFASAVNRQLLADRDRLVHFDITHLIQSNERTASSAAVMWRKAEIMTINEIRARQHLPPAEDERADDLFHTPESENKGAAEPGTNQGSEEQPVPDDQNPEDSNPNDMNDRNVEVI